MSWPPYSLGLESELSEDQAEVLISRGALSFEGAVLQANHTFIPRPRFYATVSVAAAGNILEDSFKPDSTVADTSLELNGQPLEQPSMAQCFGELPGTITLSRYTNAVRGPRHAEHLPEYEIRPRATDNLLVLQRLYYLMRIGWDEEIGFAEEFLCTQLVYDPTWQKDIPPMLERQIVLLIASLSYPHWIDFRDPSSQLLAKYYDAEDVDVEKRFWQQLLLSVELDLRLRAAGEHENAMLSHVPNKVAWDLAVSKVWLSRMIFVPIDERFLQPATKFHITALAKDAQKEKLLDFAGKMKWANMHGVKRMLEEDSDGCIPLEHRNAYTSSWITGTFLPGPSACWLAMRCLIDCDTAITNAAPGFDQMRPNFGFQYGGCTYWYFGSIVGKVMGASRGVNQSHGWVGPCIPSGDLSPLQTLLVHTAPVPVRSGRRRVRQMAARSAALGPPTHRYPVRDYALPRPAPGPHVDCVRVQKLAFIRHHHHRRPPSSASASAAEPAMTYDAAVVLAVHHDIIPVRLRYDVDFLHAPPCRGHRQHPLFWDYAYATITADALLLDLRAWNGVYVDAPVPSESEMADDDGAEDRVVDDGGVKKGARKKTEKGKGKEKEKKKKKMRAPESILVVEAYGVEDNAVLARAWASHIGFSAVVARGQETCIACAVRMAYAASVHMVIFGGEGKKEGEEEQKEQAG